MASHWSAALLEKQQVQPDVIVNAASYAPVDSAEVEPEMARVIAESVEMLAEEAR